MRIIYSYNKRGFEADMFHEEIAAASDEQYSFIPFNHDPYVDVSSYIRAQLLDNLWPIDVFVCEFLDFSEFSVLV